jgi:hypothetical protein
MSLIKLSGASLGGRRAGFVIGKPFNLQVAVKKGESRACKVFLGRLPFLSRSLSALLTFLFNRVTRAMTYGSVHVLGLQRVDHQGIPPVVSFLVL